MSFIAFENYLNELVNQKNEELREYFSFTISMNISIVDHTYRDTYNLPIWIKGFCTGNKIFIFNDYKKNEFAKLIAHEMAHAYFNYLKNKESIPLWFNEAFAAFFGKRKRYILEGEIPTVDFLYKKIKNNSFNLLTIEDNILTRYISNYLFYNFSQDIIKKLILTNDNYSFLYNMQHVINLDLYDFCINIVKDIRHE